MEEFLTVKEELYHSNQGNNLAAGVKSWKLGEFLEPSPGTDRNNSWEPAEK